MKALIRLLVLILAVASMTSCNPYIRSSIYQTHPETSKAFDVKVLELGQPVPGNAEIIGTVVVDESGFTTNCSYDIVVHFARVEASKAGGNLIRITSHKPPDFFSSCHRITAEIYRFKYQTGPKIISSPGDTSDYYSDYRISEEPPSPLPSAALTTTTESGDDKQKKWRIALSSGYSVRLAELAGLQNKVLEDHYRELMKGYHIGVEMGVAINELLSIGMRFDQMRSSNSILVTLTPEDPNEPTISGALADDIRITFIGPQVHWRILSKNQKTEFVWAFGLGYLGYEQNTVLVGMPIKTTGSTLGARTEIGLDFRIHPSVSLGFGVGLTSGTLNSVVIEQGGMTQTITAQPGEGEGLIRADFGGGIRFLF